MLGTRKMAVITTNAQARPVETSAGAVATGFAQNFMSWIAYRRTKAALSALTDRELSDIGISRSEIAAIARNGR